MVHVDVEVNLDRRTIILSLGAVTAGFSNFGRSIAAAFKASAEPKSPGAAPASSSSAIFTANLAFQDPMGGTNATPNWESVHLMQDGRIASIGWIGIHATEYSNAIY